MENPMNTFLLLSGIFIACGSKEADTSSSEVGFSSQPTSEPASAPTVEEEEGCSDLSTFDECAQCLAQENMTGYSAYASSLITYCYCGAECGDSCTDFCATGGDGSVQPSAECNTCTSEVTGSQESQCITEFSAACQADADCMQFVNDLNTCPPPQ